MSILRSALSPVRRRSLTSPRPRAGDPRDPAPDRLLGAPRPRRARRLAVAALAAALVAPAATMTVTGALPAAQAATWPTPKVPAYSASIDPYSTYEAETGCSTVVQPGITRLEQLIKATYPSKTSFGTLRSCTSAESGHEEGRALDFMLDASNPDDLALATTFLSWMLATDRYGNPNAMARRLGVMYIIWNRTMWRAYNPSAGWQPYTGTVPHTDHIHISLSWAGAKALTSYYTGGATTAAASSVDVRRLAGSDRWATSVAIGREAAPAATTVVLVNGTDGHLVDGLVAAPLARQLHAPVLLSGAEAIPDVVAADIGARHATSAVLVGSEGVLSAAVVSRLRELGVTTVERHGGSDRYSTSAAVAAAVGGTDAVVASGDAAHLVDALAAGGPAAALGRPVVLVGDDQLPAAVQTVLAGRDVVAVGGAGALPDTTLAAVDAVAGTVERVAGDDRYATAAAVASRFAGSVDGSHLVIGSGHLDHVVDSMPGGAMGDLMLLSATRSLPAATTSWLQHDAAASPPSQVTLLGGDSAVSTTVEAQVRTAVGG